MSVKNLLLASLLLASSFAFAQQISGDYIETRSADVYTGQCFANGEVNLVGNEAIMGWRVEKGSWNGVSLEGLNVVAVVRAKATLGDPYANPYPAKSVLVVDVAATPQQRKALVDFVRHETGKLTDNVEKVIYAPIDLAVVRNQEHHGMALLRAGNFVTVQTRGINSHDHICGNEVTFYPPLTQTAMAMPAVAEKDEYKGPGLDDIWSNSGKRSAFVGTFAR
jgi:hypothetical protein